jgi:hypothetical protein
MKRENYRKALVGLREYASTVGKSAYYQADDSNAVYAGLFDKIGLLRVDYHACFGKINRMGISYPKTRRVKTIALFVQVQKRDDLSEEAQYHYLEWLLNMSPWRHAFVSKSVRKVLKDRVIVIDPEQSANYMANAMMASRQSWENYMGSGMYKRINLWWDIAQHVNPTIAFAVTHQGLAMFDNQQGMIGQNSSGHAVLGHNEANLFNFVKENRKDKLETIFPDQVLFGHKPWDEVRCYDPTPSSIWRGLDPTVNLIDSTRDVIRANTANNNKKKVNPFSGNDPYPKYSRAVIAEALISEIPNWEKQIYA